MLDLYNTNETRYICDRCGTRIDVPSDSFYYFSGIDDPSFWCPACEDLPSAKIIGVPATAIPETLYLPQGFCLDNVPRVEVDSDAPRLFRPYTKRSFLRQYLCWLGAASGACQWSAKITSRARFNSALQQYAQGNSTHIADVCSGEPCAFLAAAVKKPTLPLCGAATILCTLDSRFGLCETRDEAQILRWYLALTESGDYPMLVPQPSLLTGQRRPDFVCFVPVTRFQYNPVVVLVDRVLKSTEATVEETMAYQSQGYHVKRIRINGKPSYFKLARDFKNWLETVNLGAARR